MEITQWKPDDHVGRFGLLWCVELPSVTKTADIISCQFRPLCLHVVVVNAKLVSVGDLVYLNISIYLTRPVVIILSTCSIDLKPRLSVLNSYVRQVDLVSNFSVTYQRPEEN